MLGVPGFQAFDRVRYLRSRSYAIVGLIGFALPLTIGSMVRAQTSPQIYSSTLLLYPQSLQFASQSTLSETDKGSTPDLNYTAKFNAANVAQPTNGLLQGFAAPVSNWQRNNVEDTNLNFKLLQDTVQLSIRQSQSFYAADPSYLRSLAKQKKYMPPNYAEGIAGLARVDFNVFQ